jgi:hypothetical protein
MLSPLTTLGLVEVKVKGIDNHLKYRGELIGRTSYWVYLFMLLCLPFE